MSCGFTTRGTARSFATLILVGDATHDRLAALGEASFGRWTPRRPIGSAASNRVSFLRAQIACVLVHRPGAAQSELRIGHVSVSRSTPDYHALLTLNMILGGQFVSRINMNLREKKGYTYGARTGLSTFAAGPVLRPAGQRPSGPTTDAHQGSFGELEAIRGERPVTHEGAPRRTGRAHAGIPAQLRDGRPVARAAAQLALYNLPDDYFSRFVATVLALTAEDVTTAAKVHLHPERMLTLVVGNRDTIGASIDSLGLVIHV